jgi:serine/threonine-protein kinase
VIHRDVKPDNIFLHTDAAGRVVPKLLDFGIAKHALSTFGTRTGAVLGTPDYMAPEQALDDEITPAVDVWAMGAVLYRTLCGETPFQSPTTAQTLAKLAREPAPLLRAPGLPAVLCAAVDRALAREVSGRYAGMDDFAEAIRTCAREAGFAVPASIAAQAQASGELAGPDSGARATAPSGDTRSTPAERTRLRSALLVGVFAVAGLALASSRGTVANAKRNPAEAAVAAAGTSRPGQPLGRVAPREQLARDALAPASVAAPEVSAGPVVVQAEVPTLATALVATSAADPGSPRAAPRVALPRRSAVARAAVRRPAAQPAKPLRVGDLPVAVEW